MALFQKKPQISSSVPLYTIGANKTILIVGLGNFGKEFDGTRHNIGFAAIDDFAARNDFDTWVNKKDLRSLITSGQLGQSRVILCKPTNLMNNSGEAVQATQHFYRAYNATTIIIYDELAIKFGQVRARLGGSDAGHNGIKSLINHIGDDFGRIRIGIGSDRATKADAADFVLAKFSKNEQELIPSIVKEAGVMITEYIFSGSLPHETRNVI